MINANENFDVTLDVRNSPARGKDGYTTTTASNGKKYSYRYTGGSDGAGGVEQIADGHSGTITVTVGPDARYEVTRVDFSGDIESQLSWAVGSSPRVVVITDRDTSTGEGDYVVIVKDTSADCTVPCDPPIKNKPVAQTQTK
ncbi:MULTISPECIES: hypothetical protein [unclassified Luteimonas]|uniref:hypothetical protein n=1 Tax=unclassified Luteimonas TaxID=2629088 RepID=UPI0018F0FABF|nr:MULTISPECIES: hypothetical protein [unclassified Luteimonas]MBJ6980892.1 hypothetical protein [Luteimonas sp. MC1572]MBJ7573846.1 hypothetical protein [Luteimonas sp. MC1828]QQO02251.1 hypothetical protein JGR64_08465 [Luteimonas sp. MC1572]